MITSAACQSEKVTTEAERDHFKAAAQQLFVSVISTPDVVGVDSLKCLVFTRIYNALQGETFAY